MKRQEIEDILALPVLAKKHQSFVDWIVTGLTPTQAAKKAGFANPTASGRDMMERSDVMQYLEYHRAKHMQEMKITRERIQEGLMEAIDVARDMGDAGSMIRGWSEVARLTGLNAPAKQEIEITHTQRHQLTNKQLEQLTHTQLLELTGESLEIEDVEFEEIFDSDVH